MVGDSPSILHINTSLDLALLRDVDLNSLFNSVSAEMGRRGLVPDSTVPKKRKNTEAYITKWEQWKYSITPRDIKWSWTKRGRSWELLMTIIGEDGKTTVYKRHGKTKKQTQKKLAEFAWYKYLNMGSSSGLSDDEEVSEE